MIPGEIKRPPGSLRNFHHDVRIAVVTVIGGQQNSIARSEAFEALRALHRDLGNAVLAMQVIPPQRLEYGVPEPVRTRRPERWHRGIGYGIPHDADSGLEAVERPTEVRFAAEGTRGSLERAKKLFLSA